MFFLIIIYLVIGLIFTSLVCEKEELGFLETGALIFGYPVFITAMLILFVGITTHYLITNRKGRYNDTSK